ncbi:hypothetical protein THASP1DRAFT_18167, partial [Thamnocephalis sphaerospora]
MRLSTLGHFLAAVVATTTLTLLSASETSAALPPLCPNPRYRRELRDMSDNERERFFAAMRRILDRPGPGKPSVYDSLAYYHNDQSYYTHNTPSFFPYHRLALDRLEKALQAVDPSVTLPYWDWSADAQAPEASPILSRTWFGTNGQGPNFCLKDGFYANFRPLYHAADQPGHCIQRRFDAGNRINAFASPELLADIVGNSPNFAVFRTRMEGYPHGGVHNGIGGTLSSMYSPNDPIFYMHHAFIDKLWYDWQAIDPNNRIYQYYGYDPTEKREVNLYQTLRPPFASRRVGDGMSVRHNGLCYKYL